MKGLIVICLFIAQILSLKQKANLSIITFNPPTFNLSFSKPTPLPQFQLLLNNQNVQYHITSNSTQIASFYIFQANNESRILNIQIYTLLFSQPLNILNGKLSLNSYTLYAQENFQQDQHTLKSINQRDNFYFYQNQNYVFNTLAIIVATITYITSLLDIIGLWMVQFVQIFAYIQIHSKYYTYFDYRLAYYLLIQPHQAQQSLGQFYYYFVPLIILFISFGIGLICRFSLQQKAKQSWKWKFIHQYFCYKFFIIVWRIFVFPLFVNTIHLLLLNDEHQQIQFYIVFIYLGFLLTILYLYFGIFILNPKYKESEEDWKKYMQSQHFIMFKGFYNGLCLKTWEKRNANIFISFKRLIIAIMTSLVSQVFTNLTMQAFHLSYLFIVRPYTYKFYTQASIAIQLFIVIFYVYLILVNMYSQMSPYIYTSFNITVQMLIRIILFSIIILFFLLLGGYQLYEKIKDLKVFIRKQSYDKISKLKEEQKKRRLSYKNYGKQQRKNEQLQEIDLHITKYQSKQQKFFFDQEQYTRKRNISMIKYKQKKKLQKKSLLQNFANNV